MDRRRSYDYAALLAALLLFPCLAPPADAAKGYVLEEELVRRAPGEPEERRQIRTWMTAGRLRKQELGGSVTIVRHDRDLLWVLDPQARTYFEIARADVEATSDASIAALFTGTGDDAASWLDKTGRTKKVGDWNAYEVRVDDRPLPGMRISLWLSNEVEIDKSMRETLNGGMYGPSSPAGRLLAGLRELEGHPVEITMTLPIGDLRMELSQRLKRVEPGDLEDSLFEIPADYRKVDSPLLAPPEARP